VTYNPDGIAKKHPKGHKSPAPALLQLSRRCSKLKYVAFHEIRAPWDLAIFYNAINNSYF